MRVSADKKDRGYRHDCGRYKVTLDGELQRATITADDDLGMVVRYKLTKEGLAYIDANGVIPKETVYGVVRINIRAMLPPGEFGH